MGKPPDLTVDFDIWDVAAIYICLTESVGPSIQRTRAFNKFPMKALRDESWLQANVPHDALLGYPNQLLLSNQIYLITLALSARLSADVYRQICRCI